MGIVADPLVSVTTLAALDVITTEVKYSDMALSAGAAMAAIGVGFVSVELFPHLTNVEFGRMPFHAHHGVGAAVFVGVIVGVSACAYDGAAEAVMTPSRSKATIEWDIFIMTP